ncbi:hypothetical protein KDA_67180 [Dictyobacter alpinus]|uniref:GTPase-associated protein 1 N-terminal domain-containing protein n=1 Tax=Dictyobacter alpinus TaxID=2014873 RepID=A0A402BIL1_9CHLR|nr:hypothetical protein [Dictyobacter alpinus]GCE31234.1 hypothetical protein KDA_67180 [Dictyobacter alpinus]
MDQLWYTWSTVGLGSVTGHRVRAASHELADLHGDWYREIERHLQYELPDGINPYDMTTESAPHSLAYINTERGLIMLHRAYAGEDAYGRAGAFFVHVLANLKDSSSSAAINSWGSSFWKMGDDLPPDQLDLPQVFELPVGSLNAATIAHQSDSQRQLYRQNLTFLIEAYLSLNDWQNIYIETYAEEGVHEAAERNTELIWGLLHCLPPGLTKSVTFCTYEAHVEHSPARIVGTCYSSLDALQRAQPLDGPTLKWAYGRDGNSLLFDPVIPPLADMPAAAPENNQQANSEHQQLRQQYARYAVVRLLSGSDKDLKELEALFSLSQDWQVKDRVTFLLAYKLFSASKLTAEDMQMVFDPERAVSLLIPETVRAAVLQFMVIHHPQWWFTVGQTSWEELYQQSYTTPGLAQTLADFATYIKYAIVTDLIGGNPKRANVYLPLLTTIAPPQQYKELWKSLLIELTPRLTSNQQLYPYQLFESAFYLGLLGNCSYVSDIPEDILRSWLRIPWENVSVLCQQNISPAWKARAIAWLILGDQGQFPQDLVKIVMSVQKDYEAALQYIVFSEKAAPALSNLIMLINGFGYQYGASAVSQLLFTCCLSAREIERLFRETRLKWSEIDVIFLQHWEFLLLVASDVPIVLQCTERFFSNLSDVSVLKQPGTVSLLKTVSKKMTMPSSLTEAVQDWSLIRETMQTSNNNNARLLVRSETNLNRLVLAIQKRSLQKDSYYRTMLFRYLINGIERAEDLERCKKHLSPTFFSPQHGRMAFIRELDLLAGEIYQSHMNPGLLLPYIYQTILDAWDYPKKKKEDVIPALLGSLLQNADKKTFDFIDRHNRWPDEVEKEWKYYSEDLRPGSLLGFIPFRWGSSKKNETAQQPAISSNVTVPASNGHAPVPAQGLSLQHQQLPNTYQPTTTAAGQTPLQSIAHNYTSMDNDKHVSPVRASNDDISVSAVYGQEGHTTVKALSSFDANIIAWFQERGISFQEFQRMEELKGFYFLYRKSFYKPSAGKFYRDLQMLENTRIGYHSDKNHTIKYSIKTIVYDPYITQLLLEYQPDISADLEQKSIKIIDKVSGVKDFAKYIEKKYSLQDLKEVILYFLRARALEMSLLSSNQQDSLEYWISRQQFEPIKFNQSLIDDYKKKRNI